MFDIRAYNEGICDGAREVIDLFEARLFYMPEAWRKGDGAYIINIMENTIKAAKRIYTEGLDNGE